MKNSETDILNFGDVTSKTGCTTWSCYNFFLMCTAFHTLIFQAFIQLILT